MSPIPEMTPILEAVDERHQCPMPMLITPSTSAGSLAAVTPPHVSPAAVASGGGIAASLAAAPGPPRYVRNDHPALLGNLTPPGPGRVLNFSPGPTSLPAAVEAEVRRRCLPSPHEGRLGSMALSHRSPEFGRILSNALAVTRDVMRIPPEYDVLFAQGGGHGQFAAVPMNLCLSPAEPATYIVNGTWSKRAVEEASKYCAPTVISSLEADGSCASFPSEERIARELRPSSRFLYVCSNETVNGLELRRLPRLSSPVPLVVDASSDFTSKPVEWREANIGVLFACASKNIGHPGVTLVVVRRDLLGRANPFCPGILNYETNLAAGNVWNTIPTFNVDVVGVMMEWLRDNGGIDAAEERSAAKAGMVYGLIDSSDGFFATPVSKERGHRSRMNVPFCVADGDPALTDLFLVECWERGIVGLRTVTPFGTGKYLRASLYHGVSIDETCVLVSFMREFAARHASRGRAAAPPGSLAAGAAKDDLAACSPSSGSTSLLSSSPDSIAFSIQTMPKNFKMNRYSRVNDLFMAVPPPPPAVLR